MKALIQRVLSAELKIDEETIAKIDKGLLVYLGFTYGDDKKVVDFILDKVAKIRIFEDENQKINLSLDTIKGQVMLVPNFSLYADAIVSRRPSFSNALAPEQAKPLFEYAIESYRQKFGYCGSGVFGADMKITSIADGPLNVIIEKTNQVQK